MKHKRSTVAATLFVLLLLGFGYFAWERWPRPPATTDEMLGKVTFSPMGAYKDATKAPTTAAPALMLAPPIRAAALEKLSKQAAFEMLAKSANPVDARRAYKMVIDCRYGRMLALREPEYQTASARECGDLAPGVTDDPQMRVPLLIRAAQAGVHGAYIDLWSNEVKVFKSLDEGAPETQALLDGLKQVALSTADPYALTEISAEARRKGDKEAAFALYVAARAALARDGIALDYDPLTDEPTREQAKELELSAAQQASAIAKGTEFVAKTYRSQK